MTGKRKGNNTEKAQTSIKDALSKLGRRPNENLRPNELTQLVNLSQNTDSQSLTEDDSSQISMTNNTQDLMESESDEEFVIGAGTRKRQIPTITSSDDEQGPTGNFLCYRFIFESGHTWDVTQHIF